MKKDYDVIIIGAGASGLTCGSFIKNKSVLFIDHNSKMGNKIRVSGGGRCNFANKNVSFKNYISHNPAFLKSMFARVKPSDFVELVEARGIVYAEKKLGQLFTVEGAEKIIEMFAKMTSHCDFLFDVKIEKIESRDGGFLVNDLKCKNLVIASGGRSYPVLKASDFALKIAKQFGVDYYPFIPVLSPLKTDVNFASLAGVSLKVKASFGRVEFVDDLLFTHNGISGPAALQISSFLDDDGGEIEVDFLPEINLEKFLLSAKKNGDNIILSKFLKGKLPNKFVDFILSDIMVIARNDIKEISDKILRDVAEKINRCKLKVQLFKALELGEVCKGGIDLNELSNHFEVKKCDGLFFIGETLDVAGWLGGYNIFFAFASGKILGEFLNERQ